MHKLMTLRLAQTTLPTVPISGHKTAACNRKIPLQRAPNPLTCGTRRKNARWSNACSSRSSQNRPPTAIGKPTQSALAAGAYKRGISMLPQAYLDLQRELSARLPPGRIIEDPLRRFAFGTDASFYRLDPKLVVVAEDEAEVVQILSLAHQFGTPGTFPAPGRPPS